MCKLTDKQYQAPKHGWTCFFCGETFNTIGGAQDHFGASPDMMPGCKIKVELGDERGLLMALRKAEATITKLRFKYENEAQEHES